MHIYSLKFSSKTLLRIKILFSYFHETAKLTKKIMKCRTGYLWPCKRHLWFGLSLKQKTYKSINGSCSDFTFDLSSFGSKFIGFFGHLILPLVSRGLWMPTLVLYFVFLPQLQCISSFVFHNIYICMIWIFLIKHIGKGEGSYRSVAATTLAKCHLYRSA